MKTALFLVASLNNNAKLTETLAEEWSRLGGEPHIINIVDLDLPLYSTRAEDLGLPDAAAEASRRMIKADALVFIAPEYNGSIPPSLTNLIAWISRSGDDWRGAFNNKAAVVATHSGGGGIKVLEAMRSQLSHLGANVLGRVIHTHFKKELNPDSATAVLSQLMSLAGA